MKWKESCQSHVLEPQNEGMTILHLPKDATNQVSRFIEDTADQHEQS